MSLLGNLTDLPFEDLLQVFTVQNKSGILFIHHSQFEAEVCFNKASLHSATIYRTNQFGDEVYQQGVEAALELLRWEEGDFHFEIESIPPVPANIHTTVDYIILENCRRRDEQARLATVRSLDALVPSAVANPPVKAQINLELDQWQLLLQINGIDTVAQIAQRIRRDIAMLRPILEDLESKGLIEFNQLPTTTVVEANTPTGNFGEGYRFAAKLEVSYQYQYQGTFYNNNLGANQSGQPTSGAAFGQLGEGQLYPGIGTAFQNLGLPQPRAEYVIEHPVVAPSEVSKPKVKHGLLSGIMAKIRGL
jgi:hypothetical protein